MMKMRYIFAALAVMALASCEKVRTEDSAEMQLAVNFSLPSADRSTKAESEWLQDIIIGNVAIAIYGEDGSRKFYEERYPKCMVSPGEPYQMAFNLTGMEAGTYKVAVVLNLFSKNAMTSSSGFYGKTSYSSLFDDRIAYNCSRKAVMSDNFGLYLGGDSNTETSLTIDGNKHNLDFWSAPMLGGTIEDVNLKAGLNVLGFSRAGGGFSPEVSLTTLNSDLGTSYTELPWCNDSKESETVDSKKILHLIPCYAQLIVNSIRNETGGRFSLTDIYMMNVPNRFYLLCDQTFHFAADTKKFHGKKNVSEFTSLTYSDNIDLVSGFINTWADDDFKAKTADDDFIRLLHYPSDMKVSQADFISNYIDGTFYSYDSNYNTTGGSRTLSKLSVSTPVVPSDPENGNVKALESILTTDFDASALQSYPFFILYQNDGYPAEESTDEDGNRNYRFATRLVLRGIWTDGFDSEVVYYPILVNGPDQIYNTSYFDTEASEEWTLVRKGRRYIYDITIRNKGVTNPWTDANIDATMGKIQLKVTPWGRSNEEIPINIF